MVRSLISAEPMRALARSTFVHQAGSTVVTRVVGQALTLGMTAIIARRLGPEGQGLFGLVILLPALIAMWLSGGISVSNVYFSGSGRMQLSELAGNSILVTIVGTIVGTILIIALVATGLSERIIPGVPPAYVAAGLLLLPLNLLNGYLQSLLLALRKIFTLNAVNVLQALGQLVLVCVLVLGLGFGLGGAFSAVVVTTALVVLVQLALLRGEGVSFRPTVDWKVLRTTLAFGLKGHIGNILQFLNYRLDMLIVNSFLGPAAVGIYYIAARLAELLWHIPDGVSYVIFPKSAASSKEVMNRFTPRVCLAMFGVGLLGAIVLALVGKHVIVLVFSTAFADAYAAMLWLLPGVVLLGAARVLTNDLAGRGYPHFNSIGAGVGLALTVAFDFLLIPRFGITGAACASSIAYTAVFFVSLLFYLAVHGEWMKKIEKQPTVAAPQFKATEVTVEG